MDDSQANPFTSATTGQPGDYYRQVSALSLKSSTDDFPPKIITESPAYSLLFSPLLIYGSIILFFVLFLGAICVQIVYRILDRQKIVTTLVVALMVASIPMGVRTALQVTSLETRASPDEVPRNIKITQISSSSFEITWETDSEKVGLVRYGTSPLTEDYGKTVIGDKGQKVRKHTVKLENLQKGTEYEFEILSGSKWYNNDGKPLKFQVP